MRQITRAELRAPALVLDVEETRPNGTAAVEVDVGAYRSAYCLIRSDGDPVAITFWDVEGDATISTVDLVKFAKASDALEYSPRGTSVASNPPPTGLTVAICTRERPNDLARALASIEQQSDSDFTLLVVDNAPSTTATEKVVADSGIPRKQYVVEPRPGLSRARNQALRNVTTDLVAWFDDDEVADVDWVTRLKEGFNHPSKPAAVSGLMLPAELSEEAQVRFEQYGGFNKGRGVAPEVLRAGSSTVKNPLYPLPGFGAGGNMAFRTEALHRIGGFDDQLGAGTRTHGGEETLAFVSVLRLGESILHWPPAITWHYHRREMEALKRQMFGYSAGLSAFYASLIRSRPMVMFEILKVVPLGLRDALPREDSVRSGAMPDDFPPDILRAAQKGFAEGAFLYVGEVVKSWRSSRS